MSVFTASDIVEFAIRIEENGENFYRYAVQIARDEEAKKLFAQLAADEVKHRRGFEKIFAGMDKTAPPESYEGEFAAYLHQYVDNAVIFQKDKLDQELAKVKDTPAAFDFAIRRELDSMLYYHEIKRLVPVQQHALIEEIIAEERRHFARLTALKKQLCPSA
jgi:rubrerythrin